MEENLKLEIERIVRENIRTGVEQMLARPVAQPPYGKYGKPPFLFEEGTPGIVSDIVEGSLVEPITDPTKLLE